MGQNYGKVFNISAKEEEEEIYIRSLRKIEVYYKDPVTNDMTLYTDKFK